MPRPNPKDQARAARKAALRAGQNNARRRGLYVLLGIVLIAVITVGVGWYLYVSGRSAAPAIVNATIHTSQGPIQIELYQSKTPKTVANFVNLAKTGFYNNLVWHRIVPGFVIQTGDPYTRGAVNSTRNIWGTGSSTPTVPQELDPSLHNDAGYLGMARGGDINSASCQFYIVLVNHRDLDTTNGGYAVFGKVTSGMDVVNRLASVPAYDQNIQTYGSQPIDALRAIMLNVTITSGA